MDSAALIEVEHDEIARRFIAHVGGKEAYLAYHVVRDGVLDYFTTFTPPALRNRRIASAVVRHALDYARARKLRVVPSCWFVAGYVERHPEYREVVLKGD